MIGGVFPAILVGLALTFLKLAGLNGVGAGSGMVVTGVGVMLAGIIAHFLGLSGFKTTKGIFYSFLVGLFWGTGTLLMLYAVSKLHLPMAVSASLAATNVLVVVIFSITLFGEYTSLSLPKLIIGILAILFGSILVTTA